MRLSVWTRSRVALIALSGPDALTSAAYARDFNEVKAFGSATSAVRTPEQTQTARFWNVADPAWTSLVASPPYPEYLGGHASIVGATVKGLSRLFGRHDIDLFVGSAVPGAGPTRHYTSAQTLNEDTINARAWLGIHFRKADVNANRLGKKVAKFALANYLQPTH